MVRDACRRIVGGNDTDRERCAGSREAKRPDQKIAAGCDKWVAGQADPAIDRPEAIRRLVELGLKAKSK